MTPPASSSSPAQGPARPLVRGREDREQAIMDATLELLGDVGYDRLTMDAVAARAHASKATIYRHWPGKAELVAEALSRSLSVDEALPDSGSLRQDLVLFIQKVRDTLSGQQGDLLFAIAFAARTDAALGAMINEKLLAKPSVIDVTLNQARARGEAVVAAAGARVEEVAPAMVIIRLLSGLPAEDDWLETVVDQVLLPLLSPTRPA